MRYLMMAALLLGNEDADKPRLTVHEWGTFTTVSGADGKNMNWRPLEGPSDLPGFVYKMDRREGYLGGKWQFTTSVRMETPVLYFYADRATDVGVKVAFPRGRITEWYPQAKSAAGIDWGRLRVEPGVPERFLQEKAPSHYYPARETDAAPIAVRTGDKVEREKFLFYRGVGWFPTPLKVSLTSDRVVLSNTQAAIVPHAIVFENQGGKMGFQIVGPVEDEIRSPRPSLTSDKQQVTEALEGALRTAGLYPKEAAAMIKTWGDSWFEEGLRVFSLVPAPVVDAILPLQLDPKPEQLLRVFVVRAELITPEMEQKAIEIVTRLGKDVAAIRAELKPFGRFTGPLLQRAATLSKDEALQKKLWELAAS